MKPAKSPVLLLAAAASAVAGLVHASAAGSHAELGTLAVLFGLTAIAQLGWAALAVTRDERAVVFAGIALQTIALGTWIAARTVGISFVDGLDGAQTLGLQDGLAVGLELVAIVAAGVSLLDIGARALPRPLVPVLATAMLIAVVPAMATEHDHSSHAHDGAELATDDGTAHDDGHDDDDTGDTPDDVVPTASELGYPAAFVSWLDTAETPDQRAAAEKLLVDTTEAMKAFPDEAAVQAAGYTSIGDGGTGWEHYINVGLIADPAYLDPNGIESIVLKVNPDGTKEVASAMYLLPFGFTMDDAPDIAGDLTPWHDHQNLCWEGSRVVGTTNATGSCVRGEFRATQPMIHVWLMEHECGPFAGIEGSHGSGCSHGDHGADAPDDAAAADDGHTDHDH
ncbi:hypothetical protein [Actinospongicola halichondriae]|uniref:hypothetical protein n=1 Tax=Actinospongicola halichondriae TaxID=3236844 RepID=UPI003D3B8DCD